MEAIGLLLEGFQVLLTVKTLSLMMVGLTLGIFVGVLPGLGGPNGVAILLPLTFRMDPTSAIVMLSCIYWGALFGGAITSILFNIPGEAWSVATTFDGYPMAQQGKAPEALGKVAIHAVSHGDEDHVGVAQGVLQRVGERRGQAEALEVGVVRPDIGILHDHRGAGRAELEGELQRRGVARVLGVGSIRGAEHGHSLPGGVGTEAAGDGKGERRGLVVDQPGAEDEGVGGGHAALHGPPPHEDAVLGEAVAPHAHGGHEQGARGDGRAVVRRGVTP